MIRKTALIVSIILMDSFAFSQDVVPEPERFEFPGGEYYEAINMDKASPKYGEKTGVLVVLPNKPMLQVRLGLYGNLTLDPKTRELVINRKLEDKLTPEGKEIYGLLDSMKDKDGFFHLFQSVTLRYDSVAMRKYDRIDYADYIQMILKVFE